ncbi:MAG: hypothetical protein IPF73_05825 [Betaproteobacteria bacterium]|nr:hypothetical protein [Betaproteobacteria bacterium]
MAQPARGARARTLRRAPPDRSLDDRRVARERSVDRGDLAGLHPFLRPEDRRRAALAGERIVDVGHDRDLAGREARIERRSVRAREARESVGRWLDVASVRIEEPQPQRDQQPRAAVVGAAAAEPDHEAAHAEVEQRPQLPAEARRRA